jgi:curved DNA-binding protein CbpA
LSPKPGTKTTDLFRLKSIMQRTFYDILEVDDTASANEIRKSYLKKSLQYHPDKNPNNEEEAKAKFIEIGAAYETLSDPVKRRQYDQELRTRQRPPSSSSPPTGEQYGYSSDGFASTNFTEQKYNNYRDAFDATVASMSEEELAAAVGAVTMLASVVGSIVGSRLLSGRGRNGASAARGGAGSSALEVAGSMIGSVVAGELASSGVRALHHESVQRIAYKEECRRAVERGESAPARPRSGGLGNLFKQTVENVLNAAHNNNTNRGNSPNQRGSGLDDVWRMAAEGVRAATAAHESRRSHSR